jgi:hypothetical protein
VSDAQQRGAAFELLGAFADAAVDQDLVRARVLAGLL